MTIVSSLDEQRKKKAENKVIQDNAGVIPEPPPSSPSDVVSSAQIYVLRRPPMGDWSRDELSALERLREAWGNQSGFQAAIEIDFAETNEPIAALYVDGEDPLFTISRLICGDYLALRRDWSAVIQSDDLELVCKKLYPRGRREPKKEEV